jgi:hypothetical protein
MSRELRKSTMAQRRSASTSTSDSDKDEQSTISRHGTTSWVSTVVSIVTTAINVVLPVFGRSATAYGTAASSSTSREPPSTRHEQDIATSQLRRMPTLTMSPSSSEIREQFSADDDATEVKKTRGSGVPLPTQSTPHGLQASPSRPASRQLSMVSHLSLRTEDLEQDPDLFEEFRDFVRRVEDRRGQQEQRSELSFGLRDLPRAPSTVADWVRQSPAPVANSRTAEDIAMMVRDNIANVMRNTVLPAVKNNMDAVMQDSIMPAMRDNTAAIQDNVSAAQLIRGLLADTIDAVAVLTARIDEVVASQAMNVRPAMVTVPLLTAPAHRQAPARVTSVTPSTILPPVNLRTPQSMTPYALVSAVPMPIVSPTTLYAVTTLAPTSTTTTISTGTVSSSCATSTIGSTTVGEVNVAVSALPSQSTTTCRALSATRTVGDVRTSTSTFSESNTGRTTRKERRVNEYGGEADLENYLSQFEVAARVNKWTAQDKADALILALKGVARQVLPTDGSASSMTYGRLCASLRARFGPVRNSEHHLTALQAAIRQPKESLQAFADRLRPIAKLAYPETTNEAARDALLLPHFIQALTDPEQRCYIRRMKSKTLQEAIENAELYELTSGMENKRADASPEITTNKKRVSVVSVSNEDQDFDSVITEKIRAVLAKDASTQEKDNSISSDSSRGNKKRGRTGRLRRRSHSAVRAVSRDSTVSSTQQSGANISTTDQRLQKFEDKLLQQFSSLRSDISNQLAAMSTTTSTPLQPTMTNSGRQCYNCGRHGHISRNCRAPRRQRNEYSSQYQQSTSTDQLNDSGRGPAGLATRM